MELKLQEAGLGKQSQMRIIDSGEVLEKYSSEGWVGGGPFLGGNDVHLDGDLHITIAGQAWR